jgi:hypothetical protein
VGCIRQPVLGCLGSLSLMTWTRRHVAAYCCSLLLLAAAHCRCSLSLAAAARCCSLLLLAAARRRCLLLLAAAVGCCHEQNSLSMIPLIFLFSSFAISSVQRRLATAF